MLTLTISKLWRTAHPFPALVMLLLSRELREDGEHAWELQENSD